MKKSACRRCLFAGGSITHQDYDFMKLLFPTINVNVTGIKQAAFVDIYFYVKSKSESTSTSIYETCMVHLFI